MGCFNVSGCVSKLPIIYKTECVAFICGQEIINQPQGMDFTPNTLIAPLFPAIRGTYDDYGGIKVSYPELEYIKDLERKVGYSIEEILNTIKCDAETDNPIYQKLIETFHLTDNIELCLCIEHSKVIDYLTKDMYYIYSSYDLAKKNYDNINVLIKHPEKALKPQWDPVYQTGTFPIHPSQFSEWMMCGCPRWFCRYYKYNEARLFNSPLSKEAYCELVAFWLTLHQMGLSFDRTRYVGQSFFPRKWKEYQRLCLDIANHTSTIEKDFREEYDDDDE